MTTTTEEQLSTQPAAPAAAPGGNPVRRAWRQLTSMRTALVLLFLLALAAVPGSLLPQQSLNPGRVALFYRDHPALAPVLDRLSLFAVFRAPWFAAVYLLLFVSLAGCLVPRIRLHGRALRAAPPRTPSRLHRLREHDSWLTDAPADEVLAAARGALRGWRVVVRPDGLAAEKGHHRETGNLVFHVSLVLLLVGIALGSFFGYQGSVLLVEGRGFTNTVVAYDQLSPGPMVSAQDLRPWSVRLEDFRASYRDDGEPKTFTADVRYATGLDAPEQRTSIRVNHPLAIGGDKLYLINNGYAPHVVIRDKARRVVFDDLVPCVPQKGSTLHVCTIKVPSADPQLGFTGFLFPTAAVGPQGQPFSIGPTLDNPVLSLRSFSGDLGLDGGVPQSVFVLDSSRMVPGVAGDLVVRDPKSRSLTGLPKGMTLEVDDVREWAAFQVKHDPAKRLVLLAAVLIIGGLLLSLRIHRRRVWVRVTEPTEGSGRSLVEVGGLARTDADGFAEEFPRLVARLREHVPPRDDETGVRSG